MKLIPVYAWTKSVVHIEHSGKNFRKQPSAQGVILLT